MNENRRRRAEEQKEENDYAAQTEALTRMRGMLEDENTRKRAEMMRQIQEENQRLALEKKNRDTNWKQDQENRNQAEITRNDGWVQTMAEQ